MSTKQEDIKWAINDQQLQLLYSIVSASIEEAKKTATAELKDKIKKYVNSIESLINLTFSNGTPLPFLTIPLIALINKILLSEKPSTTTTLAQLKPYGVNKNIDKLVPHVNALHILCQEEVFKSAICNVQKYFVTDCILKAEAPLYNLRQQLFSVRQKFQQLQSQKSHSTQEKDNSSLIKKAEQEIKKIESKIELSNKTTKKIHEFCDSYKVSFKRG
jgi:hypothetical protein